MCPSFPACTVFVHPSASFFLGFFGGAFSAWLSAQILFIEFFVGFFGNIIFMVHLLEGETSGTLFPKQTVSLFVYGLWPWKGRGKKTKAKQKKLKQNVGNDKGMENWNCKEFDSADNFPLLDSSGRAEGEKTEKKKEKK